MHCHVGNFRLAQDDCCCENEINIFLLPHKHIKMQRDQGLIHVWMGAGLGKESQSVFVGMKGRV